MTTHSDRILVAGDVKNLCAEIQQNPYAKTLLDKAPSKSCVYLADLHRLTILKDMPELSQFGRCLFYAIEWYLWHPQKMARLYPRHYDAIDNWIQSDPKRCEVMPAPYPRNSCIIRHIDQLLVYISTQTQLFRAPRPSWHKMNNQSDFLGSTKVSQ